MRAFMANPSQVKIRHFDLIKVSPILLIYKFRICCLLDFEFIINFPKALCDCGFHYLQEVLPVMISLNSAQVFLSSTNFKIKKLSQVAVSLYDQNVQLISPFNVNDWTNTEILQDLLTIIHTVILAFWASFLNPTSAQK